MRFYRFYRIFAANYANSQTLLDMEETKHDVFISYSSKDKIVADAICHALEQNGLTCWIAPRDVRPGARYAAEIVRGIKDCRVMVLVYSRNSNQSEHVANEVDRAFNNSTTIIPFLVDDTPMNEEFDYYLARKHWLVAYPHYAEQLDNLAKAVANVLGVELKPLNNSVPLKDIVNDSKSHEELPHLKLKADMDCIFYLDGEERSHLKAGIIQKFPLAPGEYELMFVSEGNDGDRLEMEFEMPDVDKLQKVNLCDIRDNHYQIESSIKKTIDSKRNFGITTYFKNEDEDPQALYTKGIDYLTGKTVERSYTKARFFLLKAASLDHLDAQIKLADTYYEIEYGNPQIKEAFKWYSKAFMLAESTHRVNTHLFYRLGYMYIHHEGIGWGQETREKGIKLLKRAVEQPKEFVDRNAAFELGEYYRTIDYTIAEQYYKVANEMGHPKASNALMILHFFNQKSLLQDMLHSIELDGKYGFVNYKGDIVIPCKWDWVEEFAEGSACVSYENEEDGYIEKTGYIDKTGRLIMPYKLGAGLPFSEGLAAVQNQNGKYGFINEKGQLVIPYKWQDANSFSEGLAPVTDANNLLGFIDTNGTLVIPCKWDSHIVSSFSEGMYAVRSNNGKMGYIDKKGKVIIPCIWEETFVFQNGLALVKDEHNKFGFIDKTGHIIIHCCWNNAGDFCDDMAWVEDNNKKIGYIDKTGQLCINCKWHEGGSFSEGLAPVMDKNRKWGYINKKGNLVIKCQWEEAESFEKGIAWVKIDGTWKTIDKNGRYMV